MRTAFSGGKVITGTGAPADWVLVEDGLVVAVGSGEPPAAERRVDLGGGVLAPAFRDGHVHLPATGLYELGMDFRTERSVDAIVGAFAARAAGGGILFGGNFEEPLDRPIDRYELDRAVGPQPALLARADMHSAVVSSALLERLELDGLDGVDRDPHGRPTGYLRERAAAEAWRWFDASLPPDQIAAAVERAVELCYARGIAEAHEMFVVEWRGWRSCERFLETIAGFALDVRVYLGTDEVERVHEMGFGHIGGDWFLDGSFGSHTAWLSAPYTEPTPPGSPPCGVSYRDDDELFDMFDRAQQRGMQVGVHAIGDAAISQAIRTWERVAERRGLDAVRALRHRIEHFECADDEHIAAATRLGLAASVQPAFDRYWGGEDGLYARRLGWQRAAQMNRFGTMVAAGMVLGGGSDSTVTPLDPFLQLDSLRRHHLPGERLGPAQALQLMTAGPARLAPGAARGTLAPGQRADLVLLDRDPLASEAEELLATEVLATWIAGSKVWPRGEAEVR